MGSFTTCTVAQHVLVRVIIRVESMGLGTSYSRSHRINKRNTEEAV